MTHDMSGPWLMSPAAHHRLRRELYAPHAGVAEGAEDVGGAGGGGGGGGGVLLSILALVDGTCLPGGSVQESDAECSRGGGAARVGVKMEGREEGGGGAGGSCHSREGEREEGGGGGWGGGSGGGGGGRGVGGGEGLMWALVREYGELQELASIVRSWNGSSSSASFSSGSSSSGSFSTSSSSSSSSYSAASIEVVVGASCWRCAASPSQVMEPERLGRA
jgi:hypothetical protein